MSDIRAEDWAGEMGQRWLDHLDQFETMIAPVGNALIERANFAPGQTIVDVGCGGGANSREIARRVAPGGRVTGVDVAPMLVIQAEQRSAADRIGNLTFQCLDAQTATPAGAPVDRLFSRFGVMFFDDTKAAFANMRGWLRPGGDMIFACWAPPEQNPWMGMVASVVGKYVDIPQRDPDGPGPFRMADSDVTRDMLERTGFVDIAIDLWRGEQHLGGAGATPEIAAEFVLSAMSLSRPIADKDEHLLPKVSAEIAKMLQPCYRDGQVRMEAAAWFVTARNPG
jgi:SAM-dependent methyltransferase